MASYPHMCRSDHVEIGHRDGEHEQCPLCRAIGALENARRDLLALRPRSDTGSLRVRQIEASAERIKSTLDELFSDSPQRGGEK